MISEGLKQIVDKFNKREKYQRLKRNIYFNGQGFDLDVKFATSCK